MTCVICKQHQYHPDEAVTFQRIRHHCPVARFEDVKRPGDVRERHDVLQWEERNGGRQYADAGHLVRRAGLPPHGPRQAQHRDDRIALPRLWAFIRSSSGHAAEAAAHHVGR